MPSCMATPCSAAMAHAPPATGITPDHTPDRGCGHARRAHMRKASAAVPRPALLRLLLPACVLVTMQLSAHGAGAQAAAADTPHHSTSSHCHSVSDGATACSTATSASRVLGQGSTWLAELLQEAFSQESVEYILSARRHLHTWPELSFKEHNTSAYIQAQLTALGIPFEAGVAGTTGISAWLGTPGIVPTFALRADMDALPIQEPPASQAGSQSDGQSDGQSWSAGGAPGAACSAPNAGLRHHGSETRGRGVGSSEASSKGTSEASSEGSSGASSDGSSEGPSEGSSCRSVRSAVPNVMHACGHDAHMAMLLGAARLLSRRAVAGTLPGSVVLVFQPAEEGGGGGRRMVEGGALRGAHAVGGLHVWPGLPAGSLATRAGPIMAASDRFNITLRGRGGHGAMPHMAADPVVAAAALVLALQPLVSRETSPTEAAVVTVGTISSGAGGAPNIIPDALHVQGTIRATSQAVLDRLRTRVAEVVAGTAATYGVAVEQMGWSPTPYPVTVNDPVMAALALEVAHGLAHAAASLNSSSSSSSSGSGAAASGHTNGSGDTNGQGRRPFTSVVPVALGEPSMAAEDFAFYGRAVPAVFSWLGIGDAALGTDVSLHNPHFKVDERQLPLGAAMHAALALAYLDHATAAAAATAATAAPAATAATAAPATAAATATAAGARADAAAHTRRSKGLPDHEEL